MGETFDMMRFAPRFWGLIVRDDRVTRIVDTSN